MTRPNVLAFFSGADHRRAICERGGLSDREEKAMIRTARDRVVVAQRRAQGDATFFRMVVDAVDGTK